VREGKVQPTNESINRVEGDASVDSPSAADLGQLLDFKRALDHAAIVATTDVTGRITYVNDKFCEISGYSREELVGQDHRIINSGHHSKAFIRDLWTTIARGRVWHGEIRNRAKDGHHYWVDTTIVPFLDERGKPYQYISIRVDVSARKAAEELVARQAALIPLAEMAGVVAHEVRNSLAGVKGATQILLSRPMADADSRVMRDIVARVDAASELINDLMAFARPRSPQLKDTKLRALVQEAIGVVERDAAERAIPITLAGSDAIVAADAELLRTAIVNLLVNAIQAMSGGGRIDVTISQDVMAIIDVRDTGPGIPPEIRDHVFEPFFTTKARGSGLGLPIAQRTANAHGGSLELGVLAEGGTRIRLKLPLQPAPPADSITPRSPRE
jgi:PAS domain S-box-containing protein